MSLDDFFRGMFSDPMHKLNKLLEHEMEDHRVEMERSEQCANWELPHGLYLPRLFREAQNQSGNIARIAE